MADRIDALREAGRSLCARGAPFEVQEDEVLGQRVQVFRNRHRSLRELLETAAGAGSRECYVFSDGRRIHHGSLRAEVEEVVGRLRALGVVAGDRVAIASATNAEWLLIFWATTSLGAVAVALNGWWSGPELEWAIQSTGPKVVFADAARQRRLARLCGAAQLVDVERLLDLPGDSTVQSVPAIAEDDPAVIIFTSGTTGPPKAAALSHRSLLGYLQLQAFVGAREAAVGTSTVQPAAPARRLGVLPLFHIAGLGIALASVAFGSTSVWPLGRFDAGEVIGLTKSERVTAWIGAATHIHRLVESPRISDVDPLQIQQIGFGGSARSTALVRKVEQLFPHLAGTVSTGYGSTESGGLVSWAPHWLAQDTPDCVGLPHPTVEVRITNEHGSPLPSGEEGNIEVRSPTCMLGYWSDPEANRRAVTADRWIRTGDFGRLTDGLLYLAARRRELVIRGGENIHPADVERCIEEHDDVDEVAVLGIDDEEFGQRVAAVVVPRAGSALTPADVREWCAAHIASYKVPEVIVLRTAALPRTPSGKVLKSNLETELTERGAEPYSRRVEREEP